MSLWRMCRTALFVLVFACLAAPAALAEPLAVLAAARGAVEVASASGGRVRATFGRPLERGDRVLVPAGGSATVFFSDGNVVELGEKSSLTIGARAAAKPRGASVPAEVYSNVTRFVSDGSRETGVVAVSMLRSAPDAAPLLVAPRQTGLRAARPTFRWRPVEGATRYRVLVSGDAGALWDREVAADSLVYPADAEALPPGTDVTWEVRAYRDDTELRREETAVHVLDAEAAGAVAGALADIGRSAGADSPAARFLSGSYLCGRGLYQDALEQFQSLAQATPESPAPHEAMGTVYRAVGLMDLAAAEFQRALTLSRQP